MKEFKPTYLCIKQHSVTKKLYFCKSTLIENKMLEYRGSGKYWKSHLAKHGKEFVETPWYCLFYEAESIKEFALLCSEQWDIVNVKDKNGKKIWANFKPENGLDGGDHGKNKGRKKSAKEIERQAATTRGRKYGTQAEEHRLKISAKITGIKRGTPSLEHILKIVAARTGVKRGPYKKELVPRKPYKKRVNNFDK